MRRAERELRNLPSKRKKKNSDESTLRTLKKRRNISLIWSVALHSLLILIMLLIRYEPEYPPVEFVELGFGDLGMSGSAGAPGSELERREQEEQDKQELNQKTEEKQKEIDLAKTRNTDPDNLVKAVDKTGKETSADKTSKSIGNQSPGDGSFGYDIQWGGRGKRNIYYYILPDYPAGVNKEIDIRLRFSILPDGTVGTVIPLIKADTRLEEAAINSLRKWKFEPLRKNQEQVEQTAVIVFPYRLE